MLFNHQEREGGEEMAWDVESHLHVTLPFEFSPSDWGAEEEAAAGWKQKKSPSHSLASIVITLASLLPHIVCLCESGSQNR